MKNIVLMLLLISGNLATAESYKNWEGGIVTGHAKITFERYENDRNQIIAKLYSMTDEDASLNCAHQGFHKIQRISDYRMKETSHSGHWGSISLITMSADYGCGEVNDSMICHGPSGSYKNCD